MIESTLFWGIPLQCHIQSAGELSCSHTGQLLLYLGGILCFELPGDHFREQLLHFIIAHRRDIRLNVRLTHSHLFGERSRHLRLHVGPCHGAECLCHGSVNLLLRRNAHNFSIRVCLALFIQCRNVVSELGYLFCICHIAGTLFKGKPCEDVGRRIVKLCVDGGRVFGLLNYIFRQLAGISDRPGEHGGNRIFIGTDNAGNLQGYAVVIQIPKSCVGVSQVRIQSCTLVQLITFRIQNGAELPIADFLIGPSVLFNFELGLIQSRVNDLVDLLFGFQTQRVKRHIVQLVVFVHNQYNLIILCGPGAVNQVVLFFQNRADQFSVIAGKHFLPQDNRRSS